MQNISEKSFKIELMSNREQLCEGKEVDFIHLLSLILSIPLKLIRSVTVYVCMWCVPTKERMGIESTAEKSEGTCAR